MYDDYSQIFIDFGMNSEKKVKEKVLFVSALNNDFITNHLPNTGQLSSDIDPYGYFMFDFSCQPPVPVVKGLPISLDVTHSQIQVSSIDGPADISDIAKKTHQMPVTLLVPNPRV